eukprot:3405802-Pleurochrysis_carterae.AAC.1
MSSNLIDLPIVDMRLVVMDNCYKMEISLPSSSPILIFYKLFSRNTTPRMLGSTHYYRRLHLTMRINSLFICYPRYSGMMNKGL